MTWVKSDHEWGLPLIDLKVSGRAMLEHKDLFGSRPSTLFKEPEKWATMIEAVFCRGKYQGAKVVKMSLLGDEDAILFCLTHPSFKLIPSYEIIPIIEYGS